MPTELPIEETYSYLILRTEEEKKAAEPKLATDELALLSGNDKNFWLRNSHDDAFKPLITYRRRIAPGEGCRIVGLDEVLTFKDELTIDGINWKTVPAINLTPRQCFTCLHIKATCYRRKIEPATEPTQEPKGWVLCSDGKPKDNRPVLVAMAHFRAVCQLINGEWIESYSGRNYGTVTHWRELPKEELPPIKSPDDAAFEEWFKKEYKETPTEWGFSKTAWTAALAYARKGGVK